MREALEAIESALSDSFPNVIVNRRRRVRELPGRRVDEI